MFRYFILATLFYYTNCFTISSYPSFLKNAKISYASCKLNNRYVMLSKKEDSDININAFNNVANLLIDGANAANITSVNNI